MEIDLDALGETQPFVLPAEVLAIAMLEVLTDRLGKDFAIDVRDAITGRAKRFAGSDDPLDQQEAPLIAAVAEWPLFHRLGVIANDSD